MGNYRCEHYRLSSRKKKVEILTNGKIFPFGRLPHIFNPIKKKKITGLRFIKKNNFINKVAECVTTSTSSAQLRNYNIFIYDYVAHSLVFLLYYTNKESRSQNLNNMNLRRTENQYTYCSIGYE